MLLVVSTVTAWGGEPTFEKPTPEETLKFLKFLPRVWRNTRADFRG